jgi:hypothetical protein
MGEEFPLDPNQVQPPQEEGATHIEVASHESDNQSDEFVHDEHAGVVTEEGVPPTYIRNKDKAEAMAHVHNKYGHYGYKPDGGAGHRRVNGANIERSVTKASDDYEIEALVERDGKTPEQVRELMKSNAGALLRYGHDIAENQIKYGEQLSPSLELFQTVNELATRYPDLLRHGWLENDDMSISLNLANTSAARLDIKISHRNDRDSIADEEWDAVVNSMGNVQYKVTGHASGEDGFDTVTTIKRRKLQIEDVNRLKELVQDTEFDPYFDREQGEDDQREDQNDPSDAFYAQTAGNGDDEHGPSYSQHLEDIGATLNGRPI